MPTTKEILGAVNFSTGNLSNQTLTNNGFTTPDIPSADSNGLPYTKAQDNQSAINKRNIIHFFVPEFGIVRMFVNPQSISYGYNKLINRERTKSGFNLSYWGEDLLVLGVRGHTGSSGIEGINVLKQVYRAEQYAFDSVGLSLAANNANYAALQQSVSSLGSLVGNSISGLGGIVSSTGGNLAQSTIGSALGAANNTLIPKNIPSLASMAFAVEMYYDGMIYRGYFENFNIQESADNFLWQYDFNFRVTQERGYRDNYFAFHNSANNGPSNWNVVPKSFLKLR